MKKLYSVHKNQVVKPSSNPILFFKGFFALYDFYKHEIDYSFKIESVNFFCGILCYLFFSICSWNPKTKNPITSPIE